MAEHRLTFSFSGLTQRRFNSLARKIDLAVADLLADVAGDEHEYEVYCSPGGPANWPASEVDIRLDGIRAERAKYRS